MAGRLPERDLDRWKVHERARCAFYVSINGVNSVTGFAQIPGRRQVAGTAHAKLPDMRGLTLTLFAENTQAMAEQLTLTTFASQLSHSSPSLRTEQLIAIRLATWCGVGMQISEKGSTALAQSDTVISGSGPGN